MGVTGTRGRVNQKLRTRNAIVAAAVELSRTGREVTMPEVARTALVSEATAYRYFPVLARQGVVRALIAATITRPGQPQARPGLRFGLIDSALAPLEDTLGADRPA